MKGDMERKGEIEVTYRVPYADTDQMGVVYYANYLVYFERTRNEALRKMGTPYTEIESEGHLLPVIEANCQYSAPARYDDLLTLVGWFELEGRTRLKAHCQVRRDETLLAAGYTLHVCVDRDTMRPKRLPEALRG